MNRRVGLILFAVVVVAAGFVGEMLRVRFSPASRPTQALTSTPAIATPQPPSGREAASTTTAGSDRHYLSGSVSPGTPATLLPAPRPGRLEPCRDLHGAVERAYRAALAREGLTLRVSHEAIRPEQIAVTSSGDPSEWSEDLRVREPAR